jgi:hypothetical protein
LKHPPLARGVDRVGVGALACDVGRGGGVGALTGGGRVGGSGTAGAAGGYHLPSVASHQSGACPVSLTVLPRRRRCTLARWTGTDPDPGQPRPRSPSRWTGEDARPEPGAESSVPGSVGPAHPEPGG